MTGKREDIPAGLLAGYGKIAGERVKGDVRVRPATVVVVTFALGACLGTNEGPATSPEPSEEVETQTLTGTSLTQAVVPASSATTLSPEPTTIPTLNPALPTPDFTQSEIADQYLLAPSGSGCQLPCWQGLRIGVSTREDVLGVLNSLFDFGGYVDFFDDNSVTKLDSVSRSLLDVPGVEGSGYSWVTTETLFSLLAVVDAETGVLQGLQFRHVTGLYTERLPHRYTIRTPREIIEQLGSPAAIYTTGQGSWLMAVLLFYEQGIVSYSLLEVQDGQHLESGQITRSAEFCLNDQAWVARDSIVEPFESNQEQPITSSPINDRWVGAQLEGSGLHPVSEALGLSIEEFVSVSQSDQPCIELDYDSLPPTR